ncbi:MAG TPA: DUF4265 domain-containing protein [Rhizomicrobium sp.]|jgi:hypothetical protein
MTADLVKVSFDLDPDEWHRTPSETLWAKPLGQGASGQVYVLENTPFYAKGVSFLDVIRAEPDEQGSLRYCGTVGRGGHSTYRIIVNDAAGFGALWGELESLGCSYESADFQDRALYAVDVSESTDIYAVYKVLKEGEGQRTWLFEEGHVGHELK